MSNRLYEVKVKLLSACDYRCRMCGHWREPVERLSTQEALGVLRDAASLGARSVIFSGGEPTLHEGLVECVREAARLGLRVTLATNGGGLAPGRLESLLEAGVAQLNVSVDGPSAEVHDRIRGMPGSFDAILRGARRAADLGRPVALKTVVTRTSYARLAQMPRLADLAPLCSLSFTLVTANEPVMQPLTLGRADLDRWFFEVLPSALEGAAARGLPVKLFPIFRGLYGLRPAALAGVLRAARSADFAAELDAFAQGRYGEAFAARERCPVLRGKVLVRPDGGVFFCCEVSHAGDYRMGDVRAAPGHPALHGPRGLAAAWTSAAYSRLRAAGPTPVHERCFSCTEWFSRPPEALLKIGRAA